MLKNIETNAFATVLACADVTRTANRYFEKTSVPDNTKMYICDWNGPTRSVCIMSPGKSCSDENR